MLQRCVLCSQVWVIHVSQKLRWVTQQARALILLIRKNHEKPGSCELRLMGAGSPSWAQTQAQLKGNYLKAIEGAMNGWINELAQWAQYKAGKARPRLGKHLDWLWKQVRILAVSDTWRKESGKCSTWPICKFTAVASQLRRMFS